MPAEGIEPPAFGLQNRCTTAVLRRPRKISARKCFFPQYPIALVPLWHYVGGVRTILADDEG